MIRVGKSYCVVSDGVDEDPSIFKARVVATVEDMIARHPGGRVVVVCHGGVINQYLAHVLGMLLLYRARGSAAIVFTRPTIRVNRASA